MNVVICVVVEKKNLLQCLLSKGEKSIRTRIVQNTMVEYISQCPEGKSMIVIRGGFRKKDGELYVAKNAIIDAYDEGVCIHSLFHCECIQMIDPIRFMNMMTLIGTDC